MDHSALNEYSNVVRHGLNQTTPLGYTLVSTSAPAILQLFCRTFTFAQGLTLYEVWDAYNQRATAYLVPTPVHSLAISEFRNGVTTARWNHLPLHQRSILWHARELLLQQYPRMPEIAAIRIAERAEREGWNGLKVSLEGRVVNHIRHEWTSYVTHFDHYRSFPLPAGNTPADARLRESTLSRHKNEVLEAVKPRMREILVLWLPQDISSAALASLFQRHDLFDSANGNGQYTQANMLVRTNLLRYHGGLETPSNLLAKTELIM